MYGRNCNFRGSTKIGFLGGAAVELDKKHNFKIYSGISAGAIINLLLPLGEYDLLKKSIVESDVDDLFKVKPANDKDQLTLGSIWRVVRGKNSLGAYTMKKLLKQYYKPEHHVRLQECGKIVIVGAVNFNTEDIEYCDITKVDYETALDWVTASSSIPITCEPVKIGDCYYYDGGVREHVSGIKVLNSGATSLCVVFSRPEHLELSENQQHWLPSNVFKVAVKTLRIMSKDITFEDEEKIKKRCKAKKKSL